MASSLSMICEESVFLRVLLLFSVSSVAMPLIPRAGQTRERVLCVEQA